MKLYLLVSCILGMTFFSKALAQFDQVPDHIEYQALVDLYNSTNGDGWINKSNWLNGNASSELDAWFGIKVENGDVIELSLISNNLNGTLPESICSLKKLRNLRLNKNNLSGAIPAHVGDLLDLKSIDLGYNSLTGKIPESIINLINLTSLNLEFNRLNGAFPKNVRNWTNLKGLYMRNNSLDGFIPSDVTLLTNLEKIDLRNNSLSGKIPADIGNLVNLIYIFAGGNALTGTIPESFGNCLSLTRLHLQSNNLSGNIPDSLRNLKKLTELYIQSNQLSGEVPQSIGGMTNLRALYISNNNLSGTLPSSLGNLQKLETLQVAENELEGAIPATLTQLPKLQSLSIHRNKFDDLPDFTDHPSAANIRVGASYLRFKLKDIEKHFTAPSNNIFSSFNYHSQSPMPPDTLAFTAGQIVILDTEDHAPHNQFQWQKMVNGGWTNIPNATSGTYSMSSISASSTAAYRCKISNDWVNLTIYSKTYVVQPTSEFWSVANGNWTTDRIWSTTKGGAPITGYPKDGSKVFIVGNNVTLDTNLACGPLEVIVENAEASLTVDGAEITVRGEVKLTKATEGYPGNIKVVNGGKVRPIE